MNYQLLSTPLGQLRLVSTGTHLSAIEFAGTHGADAGECHVSDEVLAQAAAQLTEYFARQRKVFDLPLAPKGTDFQQQVWQALTTIPWGSVRSYADIAQAIEKPKAVRAVGAANGRNPLPIVVPCHRVIGSDGSLTGFAGGLDMKRQLLELEGALQEQQADMF